MTDYQQWIDHVTREPHEPLAQERIDEMLQWTNRFGSSNNWTGTSGTLAKMIRGLLRERHELLRLVKHHEAFVNSMGYVGPKWENGE